MRTLDAFPNELDDDVLVYRAIRASWFDPETDELTAPAFTRRAADNPGISTNNTEENARQSLQNPNAIVVLLVDCIRKAGLDVIPDEGTHADIVGLPSPEEIEESPARKAEALFLANKLRDCAEIVWRKPVVA